MKKNEVKQTLKTIKEILPGLINKYDNDLSLKQIRDTLLIIQGMMNFDYDEIVRHIAIKKQLFMFLISSPSHLDGDNDYNLLRYLIIQLEQDLLFNLKEPN